MSFSASTCLTNTGTGTLGPTLNVYSNPVDQYTPGTFVTNVPKDDITGGNCPYVLELPDGTTSIRLSDPLSGCYVDIPISDNNMCTTCNINFDTYQSPSIGTLVVGSVTGTCEDEFTDYLINWYDVSDPNNPTFLFKTGKGTQFQPYLYTHPLTGGNIPLAPSGLYSAVLEKIIINGITFSRDGEPGTVLADLDCLPSLATDNPIEVQPLTCTNGTSDLPQYKHQFNYNAGTGGLTPQPLKTSFSLSAGTQFFPWKFRGYNVPDQIKITLSGSAYSEPILMDYWTVGSVGNENWNPSVFPKSANTTSFLGRIIDMSNMTINNGDELLIEVIPSTANTQTSWDFYCGCLDTYDCDVCTPNYTASTVSGQTNYINPIILSSLTAITSNTCSTSIYFNISGNCTYYDIANSDPFLYSGYNGINNMSSTNQNSLYFSNLYLDTSNCSSTIQWNPAYTGGTSGCITSGSGVNITYAKSPGLFKITSNNLGVISQLYNQSLGIQSLRSPFSGDNTNIEYYKYFEFYFMKPASTVQVCGDGVISSKLRISQAFTVTTGTTGSDYYIQLTLPTMTYGMTFPGCSDCPDSLSYYVVDEVNSYSTGATYNWTGTTNTGMLYGNPILYLTGRQIVTTNYTAQTINGFTYFNQTPLFTYPASGSSNTLIPSFSAETCPNIGDIMNISNGPNGTIGYQKYYYSYLVTLFDPTNKNNFRIYSYYITQNGTYYNDPKTLIYEWSGGTQTYINSQYFI